MQVKYLANPAQGWINEHTIGFTDDNEDYALVTFVDFRLESVLVFPRETIGQVCKLLGKRHPHQETSLQFTEKNHEVILARQTEFHALGVEIYRFTKTASDDIGGVG